MHRSILVSFCAPPCEWQALIRPNGNLLYLLIAD